LTSTVLSKLFYFSSDPP